jgi:hypothetical protein
VNKFLIRYDREYFQLSLVDKIGNLWYNGSESLRSSLEGFIWQRFSPLFFAKLLGAKIFPAA